MKTILGALDPTSNRTDSGRKPDFKKFNSSKTNFLTLKAQIAFMQFQKAFTTAPILHHFGPKRHIRIKIDDFD